ncbi:YncE family protein [Nocardioides insulae]|uniref:YncE family protein n=1 Tax=Nocardioides insulae TaxID=394734 RepID=UPI00048A4C79|nr:YncE family protein [Nocardioides insulae]
MLHALTRSVPPPHRRRPPRGLLVLAGSTLLPIMAPSVAADGGPAPAGNESAAPATQGTEIVTSSPPGALGQGLYQTAVSTERGVVYATTAGGGVSRLHRLDRETLTPLDSVSPPAAPSAPELPLAAYGVGVDDQHGTVWLTHSRDDTVSVVDQDTLRPLHTHPLGTVPGARDVQHDPVTGRVFVTSAAPTTEGTGSVSVFEGDDEDGDGVRFEKIGETGVLPRSEFSPMSLASDPSTGKIWTVSLSTPRAMSIDTRTLRHRVVELDLPDTGSAGPSGVAVDPRARRLYITSQDDGILLVTDYAGRRIAATRTGPGALSVAFERRHRRVYVTDFAQNSTPDTTVSVLSARGRLLHRIPLTHAHHVRADGRDGVLVSTLGGSDQILRLTRSRG